MFSNLCQNIAKLKQKISEKKFILLLLVKKLILLLIITLKKSFHLFKINKKFIQIISCSRKKFKLESPNFLKKQIKKK